MRSLTVGVKEDVFTENTLSLFPNPTDGKIYFKSHLVDIDKIDIEIRSVIGSLLLKQDNLYVYDGAFIDLSGLPGGVYLAHIKFGKKTLVKKVILSK